MQHFRDILVGIELSSVDPGFGGELSPASDHALRRAIWLARHSQGKLTIFSTLDFPPFMQTLTKQQLEQPIHDLEQETREVLGRFVLQANGEGVKARSKLTFGIPWHEMCRQVQLANHDLVIVGTRDLGRAGRFLLGSTGMKLVRNCPCPVWITRPDMDWDHLNILVPSDFSDVSLEAIRIAVNGAQLVDTRIHVLHALEGPVGPPAWYGRVPKQMVEDYIAWQHADAKKKLHEQLGRTNYRSLQHGLQVHVVEGPADEAILKAIDQFQISLVVMGTAARSGIAALALGNTTERLLSHLQCSLIAVKPAGFQCPITLLEQSSVQQPSPSTALSGSRQ